MTTKRPKTTSKPTHRPVPLAVTKGRLRLTVVGSLRVGGTLSALVRPKPTKAGAAALRRVWSLCDWTGNACVAVAKGVSYRIRAGDLGRTLRVALARPGAAAIEAGPTAIVVPRDGPPTVAAAGDIACDPTSPLFKNGAGTSMNCRQLAVSDLVIAQHPTAVLTLGDTQYECGDQSGFAASFEPSWGRLKPIIHPAIGNHEYGKSCHRDDPSPYFTYFGAEAGKKGWYSYDIGAWHFVVLNSECNYGAGASAVDGCQPGSPQESWLRRDLAAHHNVCTIAYWHEPRFSSGEHGDAMQMGTIWNDLVAGHVDIVLSGHNHDYERFDPIGATPEQQTQPNLSPSGIREFVVGTGGRNLYGFASPPLQGEVLRQNSAFGTLLLTLQPTGYAWHFLPLPGSAPADEGSGACH